MPIFHGWMKNQDGTFTSFLVSQSELAGRGRRSHRSDNNVSAPYGPDGGQPTHFFPRINRWVFSIRVPKDFDRRSHLDADRPRGNTSHVCDAQPGIRGRRFSHHARVRQLQRGRKWLTVKVEGEKQRTVKSENRRSSWQLLRVRSGQPQGQRGRGARALGSPARPARTPRETSAAILREAPRGDFGSRGLCIAVPQTRSPSTRRSRSRSGRTSAGARPGRPDFSRRRSRRAASTSTT